MTNFKIAFLNSPWWLILLIPAFFLTLFPYFRIAKKYRRNRNRIISLVLHLVIMTLCIFTLSGIYFTYDKADKSNEVLILVDRSYSGEQYGTTEYDKDDFVRSIIDDSGSKYKVGVITFGYDQVYAAKMSTNTDEVFRNYLNADLPNDSASNIAGALDYARSLFTNQRNGKVVLISDGAQTDGDAETAIKMMIANGIQVNTAHFPNTYAGRNEVLISDIELPKDSVSLDEEFTVSVTVRARNAGIGHAKITLFDDSTADGEQLLETQDVDIVASEQKFEFAVTLTTADMHKLRFNIQ
ncbi:MAG: VWA domain-containing protein, partial [Clostridiales bacterium]|nr:VWA domain-containing protein [Clostridiales bacterium]